MRNFLDLLRDGGELHVSVPYELSCGAWQDPTHVRAFNENSWLYYTKWAWYLGWRDHRFDLVSLLYSKDGKPITEASGQEGATLEELLRTPRAIDSMHIVFRKRQTTEEEKEEHALMTRAFYNSTVSEWSVRDDNETAPLLPHHARQNT